VAEDARDSPALDLSGVIDPVHRLTLAQQLSAELETEIGSRSAPKTLPERLQKRALTTLHDQIAAYASVLAAEKVRLVFIGQVGVGKTTAICRLLGLTGTRTRSRKSRAGRTSEVEVVGDLLATGSGFTTLCEVEIRATTGSNRFLVEPYSEGEVRQTIEDFCASIWSRAFPGSEGVDEGENGGTEQINFPPELVRGVRNMLQLPHGDRKEDDAALRLALACGLDGKAVFLGKAMELAGLERRVQTELLCPDSEADPREWIRKTFDDLNLMRLESVSIPRRIRFEVSRKLVSSRMEGLTAVVDTKGVDAAQFNRSDLDEYIRNDPSAICVLSEKFDTAPTNVLPLLQRHVTPEVPLMPFKLVLLIIPRANEPERLQGPQGQVDDRELGLNIRRQQIEETLTSRGVPGISIIFYDPLLRYGENFRLREDSSEADVQADSSTAWEEIEAALQHRSEAVWGRVVQVSESLQRIRQGKGLSPEEESIVSDLRAKVSQFRQLSVANADRFREEYRRLWQGPGARHPMSLRATNNRYGVYPVRIIDVSYDGVPIAERLVRSATQNSKGKIVELIQEHRDQADENSDLRELFSVLQSQVDQSYDDMVKRAGQAVETQLRNTVFAPSDQSSAFWTNVQNRYGQGKGFRDDVLGMYSDQMEDVERFLRDSAEGLWQTNLVDPVLDFLSS
jgi:hypothetical protein